MTPVVMQGSLGTIGGTVQMLHVCLLALTGLLRANGGTFVVSVEEAFKGIANPDDILFRVTMDEETGIQMLQLDIPPSAPGIERP